MRTDINIDLFSWTVFSVSQHIYLLPNKLFMAFSKYAFIGKKTEKFTAVFINSTEK